FHEILLVDGEEPDGIPLLLGQEGETGHHGPGELQLGGPPFPMVHGGGGIQDELDHYLALLFGLADIVAPRSGQHLPIEQSGVIPRFVGPVLAKFHAGPQAAAAVQAREEGLHHDPGNQGQPGDRPQEFGGHKVAIVPLFHYLSFIRMVFNSSWVTASASIPSASALKFTRILCRSTGGATACRSSGETARCPPIRAWALAVRIMACPARGPAPHSTQSRTKAKGDVPGRLARTNSPT